MKKLVVLGLIIAMVCSLTGCVKKVFADSNFLSRIISKETEDEFLGDVNDSYHILPTTEVTKEDDYYESDEEFSLNNDAIMNFEMQLQEAIQREIFEAVAHVDFSEVHESFDEFVRVFSAQNDIDISGLGEEEMDYLLLEFLFGIISELQ